ncbi:MAG TPA: hypothetical protein VK666_03585, partial [Chryseolinea sp.]|nr:hypothetical protein [Chryseolinea sp.]
MALQLMSLLAILTTALSSGVLFAWSCSVIPGLRQLPDDAYIQAIQSMNRAIQNPVFFSCFFGAVIFLGITCYLQYQQGLSPRFWLILAAAAIYLVGVTG